MMSLIAFPHSAVVVPVLAVLSTVVGLRSLGLTIDFEVTGANTSRVTRIVLIGSDVLLRFFLPRSHSRNDRISGLGIILGVV